MPTFKCSICEVLGVELVMAYNELMRVSSDCKLFDYGGHIGFCRNCGAIQKPQTRKLQQGLKKIYQQYSLYYQGGGDEQKILDSTGISFAPRSEGLIETINKERLLFDGASVLDFGCGNGCLLSQFGEVAQCIQYGYEVSDSYESELKKNSGFSGLYTGNLATINRKFDLIVFNHSLEHIVNIRQTLKILRDKLEPNGRLLIQVPDIEKNPFDLIIADHIFHFTTNSLSNLLKSVGYEILSVAKKVSKKEITLIVGRAENSQSPTITNEEGGLLLYNNIDWLQTISTEARLCGERVAAGIALFGSSISAVWLSAYIKGALVNYVDEDDGRVGAKIDGVEIVRMDQLPAHTPVYLGVLPSLAKIIAHKYSDSGRQFILPSPIILTN